MTQSLNLAYAGTGEMNNETKNAKLGQSNKKKAKYQTKLVVSSF